MMVKVALLCGCLLAVLGTIQCATFDLTEVKSNIKAQREILNINGKQYLVLSGEITLEGAWAECRLYNAELVSFDTENEYVDVLKGIKYLGYANQWFWTAGQRNKNSDDWFWSPSDTPIEEFFWIPGHPRVPNNVTSCMNFNIQAGGWAADPCDNNYVLGIVCE